MTLVETYCSLSGEYYDTALHPTCANFRQLSEVFFGDVLRRTVLSGSRILEVGAGKSIAAPVLLSAGIGFADLLLTDSSAEMLAHSRRWASKRIRLASADAASTGLDSDSVDIIVGGLADPYNDKKFWKEVWRLLRNGGICAVTLPAFEWATRFRNAEEKDLARFELTDGKVIDVPSYVYPVNEQLELMGMRKLELLELVQFTSAAIVGSVSPKLIADRSMPVLTGFVLRKVH